MVAQGDDPRHPALLRHRRDHCSGGSWNAAIVAEVASWGNTKLEAHGLGAYIADATANGDMGRVVLGVVVMSIFVLLFNRLLWRPLYGYSERHLKLG